MKVNFKIFRVANVPTTLLKGAVGLEVDVANDKADLAIREKFGPHMAYGFKIFWPEAPGYNTTVVGMEAMSFEIGSSEGTPKAPEGIVTCDPIDAESTSRIDGGLQSELMRLGVPTEPEHYEWRGWYAIKPGSTMPYGE